MSLDAINSGFADLRTIDEGATEETKTLAQLRAGDGAQAYTDLQSSLTSALGLDASDIDLLLNNAQDLTIDQAIAYMYQMVSLADTDASTAEIELGTDENNEILTLEEALGDALGLGDEVDIGAELGDIAVVFSEADIDMAGMDTPEHKDDVIELDFTNANETDLNDALESLEDSTASTIGLADADTNTIVSWGYIPNDINDDSDDEFGFELGTLEEFQAVHHIENEDNDEDPEDEEESETEETDVVEKSKSEADG